MFAAAFSEAAYQGVQGVPHSLDGDPAGALLDVAERNEAAIVVVGSKGMRSGEREWFGNVPDKISHKGTCSVLMVFDATASDDADGEAVSKVAAADAGSSAEDVST